MINNSLWIEGKICLKKCYNYFRMQIVSDITKMVYLHAFLYAKASYLLTGTPLLVIYGRIDFSAHSSLVPDEST